MKKLLKSSVILLIFALTNLISCQKESVARPTTEPCSINLALLNNNWTVDSVVINNVKKLPTAGDYWSFGTSVVVRVWNNSSLSTSNYIKFKNVVVVADDSYVIDELSSTNLTLYWKTNSTESTYYFHRE